MLHARGLNPVEELLKLLPQLTAIQQVEIWTTLIGYVQPKPREIGPDQEDLVRQKLKDMTTQELIERAKSVIPELEQAG